MRVYSYLFHFLLALFLLGISIISWFAGEHNLQVGVLPWQGDVLSYVLFASAVAGLLVTWLAVKRRLPVLFLIWSVVVFLALVRGYFLSSYRFGRGGLTTALLLTSASLLAAIGGWHQFRTSKTKPASYERSAAL